MTKAGRCLLGTESTFGTCSVVLSHTFAWTDRRKVLDAFSEALKVDPQKWIFGGAYLFWAQPMDSCRGEAIYIGETADFVTRLRSHLIGPADRGNKHSFRAKQFEGTSLIAGLALLVVSPDQLDYHDSPTVRSSKTTSTSARPNGSNRSYFVLISIGRAGFLAATAEETLRGRPIRMKVQGW